MYYKCASGPCVCAKVCVMLVKCMSVYLCGVSVGTVCVVCDVHMCTCACVSAVFHWLPLPSQGYQLISVCLGLS